jgi:hypothetical protein
MSLPYRFLYEGLHRISELMKNERFTFIVNGRKYETNIVEACLLSPKVHYNLEQDNSEEEFYIQDEKIEDNDFSLLFQSIRGFESEFCRRNEGSLIHLCHFLGNDRLESLFRCGFEVNENNLFLTCESGFDANVNDHASHFYHYSIEDLRGFGSELLDAILSSESLQLSTETSLLKTILSLGSQFRFLLHHVRVEFLSLIGLETFVEHLCISDIDDSLLSSIKARLVGKRDGSECRHRLAHFLPSRILSDFGSWPAIFDELYGRKFELLYRSSRECFRISEFHRLCDGHCHTLTILQSTKGCIFGGYTPLAWQSSGGYQRDSSLQTFLFSLKNPRDSIGRRFDMKSDGSNAIYCYPDRLAFGYAHDLVVYNNANTEKNSTTDIGSTFDNYTGIDGKLLMDGESNFTVQEIEVLEMED